MIERRSPLIQIWALYVLALVLAAVFQSGCGPGTREKALTTTLHGVNAARDGFVSWDKAHQLDLVAAATSLEDGKAKLASYREKRDVVTQAFEIAYRSIAIAATTKDTPLTEMVNAAKALYDAIKTLQSSQ